jgi:Uroporphyrinogen decarboxylase (URO-D)
VTSRDLVERALQGKPTDRRPILMHLAPYAARLQQQAYQQLAGDPTLQANAQQGAQRLFGCDGVLAPLDTTLEAEACGCLVEWRDDEPMVTGHPFAGAHGPVTVDLDGLERRGRLAVALEATRRLQQVIGRDVAIVPAVTGPVTLAGHLLGPTLVADLDAESERGYQAIEAAARVTVHMAKLYLEAGGGQLFVADPLLGSIDPSHYPQIAGVLRTLWNVADFYDVRALVWTLVADADRPSQLLALGAGGLVIEGDGPLGAVAAQAEAKDQCVAAGLPPELFMSPLGEIAAAVAGWRDRVGAPRTLYVCPRIPRSAAPENVRQVLHELLR